MLTAVRICTSMLIGLLITIEYVYKTFTMFVVIVIVTQYLIYMQTDLSFILDERMAAMSSGVKRQCDRLHSLYTLHKTYKVNDHSK